MTHLAQVLHSKDGYRLRVVQVPLWAHAAEKAGEWLCDKTGSILCAGGLPGWAWEIGLGRRDEGGWPRWNAGTTMFSFGQWFHSISMRRERELYSVPLTVEQVKKHFPASRIEFLEQP